MNAVAKEQDHGKENAAAWAGSIVEMVAAIECDYDRLEALRDERADLASEAQDDTNAAIDEALEALREWDDENGEELRELHEAATLEGHTLTSQDDARERIEESALSCEVRSGWANVGDALNAEEFRICLTAGGPALQIRGELDEHGQPDRAWLEYQNWGTGWTQYFDIEQSTLLTFAQVFYFGE